MFVRQNQQQFRNSNADVQIFYGDATATTAYRYKKSWNKPPGVSHVYMMLIGSGGNGTGSSGGGSASVTVWYGAAQNVPDQLEILVGSGLNTTVSYRGTSLVILLSANSASGATGAGATTATIFPSSGFYQSVAGQNGASGTQTASTTTFLSGGSGGGGSTLTTNYGYVIPSPSGGFFMLQPIIVGAGGNDSGNGGIGCGGGVSVGTKGGPGMVLIASW